MTDRPLLFRAPMVRALRREIERPGTGKTQTRRVLKNQPGDLGAAGKSIIEVNNYSTGSPKQGKAYYWQENGCWNSSKPFNPPYQVGDRIWVRETLRWRPDGAWEYAADDSAVWLEETDQRVPQMVAWAHHEDREVVPSIHMPRWASRLTLHITDVRYQKVNRISQEDALAEGIERMKSGRGYYDPVAGHGAVHLGFCHKRASQAFRVLWDSIHGEGHYDLGLWVAALTFTVRQQNIDKLGAVQRCRLKTNSRVRSGSD